MRERERKRERGGSSGRREIRREREILTSYQRHGVPSGRGGKRNR